jgi:hypothetical protein
VTHRRASRLAALPLLLVAVLASLAACGPATTPSPPTPPASLGPLVSPVTGRLIAIDAEGLSKVTAFRLRTDDGREVAFEIGVLENGAEFPPGHLAEHMANASPVRVFFRDEGGRLVVYRLEDG